MNMLRRDTKKPGFTLVELLVVIAIIGILATLILPQVMEAMAKARMTKMGNDGNAIVKSLFVRSIDNIYLTTISDGWPKYNVTTVVSNDQYRNTSEFFLNMVTSGTLKVSFSAFAGPGVPAAQAATQFKSTNNAWRFVADITEAYPETAPCMWTKNLSLSTIGESMSPNAARDGIPNRVYDMPPFGYKCVVFVTKGGQSYMADKDNLHLKNFTNLFLRMATDGTTLTNRVLDP